MNNETNMEKSKIVNTLVEKLHAEREKAKQLVSDNTYILWLENFTNIYPKFTDDLHEHYPDKLSSVDCQNISDLYLFFQGIDNYASQNFIASETEEIGFENEYYLIVYNDICYQIGTVSGQGTFAYCDRIKTTSEKVINFNDVIANKQQKNKKIITEKLKLLSDIVQELNHLNVPLYVIFSSIEQTLDNSD